MSWFARRRKGADGGGREAALRRVLRALVASDGVAAEAALAEVVRADSRDCDSYLALAQLYCNRGEFGRAVRLQQMLLLRSDLSASRRVAALCGLGRAFRGDGAVDRAIASFEEVLELAAVEQEALLPLVDLYADKGDCARAFALAQRAARLQVPGVSGKVAPLLTRLAIRAHEVGDAGTARKIVKQVLRSHDAPAAAAVLLGDLEVERGRSKAALRAWQVALECSGADRRDLYGRLEAGYAARGRGGRFEALLRARIVADPDDLPARMALARRLVAKTDVAAGLQVLEELLVRDAGCVEARVAVGRLLLEQGRHAEAMRAYQDLLEALDRPPRRIALEAAPS